MGIHTLRKLEYLAFTNFQCAADVLIERSFSHSGDAVVGVDVFLDRLTARGTSQHVIRKYLRKSERTDLLPLRSLS